jgi:hypothetical protein
VCDVRKGALQISFNSFEVGSEGMIFYGLMEREREAEASKGDSPILQDVESHFVIG